MNQQQTDNTDEQQTLQLDPPLEENRTITALTAENEKLRQAIRLRDARDAITTGLTAAGARSPTLLFESITDKLQFDESGALQNAAALVAMLKESYPEQFADPAESAASIDAGSGRGQTKRPLTREILAGLSANEIAKLDWAEVRQALGE